MRQGLYQDSLSLLDQTLPANLENSDIAVWQNMTNAADSAFLFHFDAAQDYLERAKSIIDSSRSPFLGEYTLRKGTVAFLSGDSSTAFAAYRTTLDVARKGSDGFLEAAALGSLGLVSTRIERYDESLDWNKQALRLALSLGDINSVSRIEGNTAWSYHELGDLEAALEQFQRAEEDAGKAGLLADRTYWLNSVAGVDYDLHDYSSAEAAAYVALSLARGLNDHGAMIECLQNLALVAQARDQLDPAREFLSQAEHLQNTAPDYARDLYTKLIAAHLALARRDFTFAYDSFSAVVRESKAPASIRWEAQAGLAEVYAAQGKTSLAEREFNESISTIAKARDALEHEEFRLSFLSSAIRFYDAYVNFLIAQKRPLAALKIAEQSRAQTLERGLASNANGRANGATNLVRSGKTRGLAHAVAFRPQATARRLKATLLFYWLGEEQSHAWAITPTGISLFPLPRRAEIDSVVRSYRDSFTGPRDPLEAGNENGRKLYSALIQPAENLIPKNSRVIVLADGSLNSLNFETVIVPGPKAHYWIEDVTVLTANSLSLLPRASVSAPPKAASLLLMGDALSASPDFPVLPQAGKEIGLVETHFPKDGRTVLTGAQATASHFLEGKPEAFAYLHFATHGTASTARPLESAVILSQQGDSYKLYARDIVQHPLHAYLVTISACNGAGMRTYAGEGLVGLAWAFLRAGAHNVIAGLWEVSNASTPRLMDELYKGLNAGKDPATALRDAKLTLVHSQGNYKKPFYWAPFQLYAGS